MLSYSLNKMEHSKYFEKNKNYKDEKGTLICLYGASKCIFMCGFFFVFYFFVKLIFLTAFACKENTIILFARMEKYYICARDFDWKFKILYNFKYINYFLINEFVSHSSSLHKSWIKLKWNFRNRKKCNVWMLWYTQNTHILEMELFDVNQNVSITIQLVFNAFKWIEFDRLNCLLFLLIY